MGVLSGLCELGLGICTSRNISTAQRQALLTFHVFVNSGSLGYLFTDPSKPGSRKSWAPGKIIEISLPLILRTSFATPGPVGQCHQIGYEPWISAGGQRKSCKIESAVTLLPQPLSPDQPQWSHPDKPQNRSPSTAFTIRRPACEIGCINL